MNVLRGSAALSRCDGNQDGYDWLHGILVSLLPNVEEIRTRRPLPLEF